MDIKKKNPEVLSNRDDSKNRTNGTLGDAHSPFAKDKRPRTTRTAPIERKSFNPNFTSDNRKKEGGQDRDEGFRSKPGDGGQSGGYQGKPTGSDFRSKPGGNRSDSSHDSYGNRSDKPRSNYGNRDNRSGGYQGKPYGKPGSKPGMKPGNRPGGFRKKEETPEYTADNYPRFAIPKSTGAVRLNKFIANSGVCSRREADELIESGQITVNGKVITEMGAKIMAVDEVHFNGELLKGEPKVYIVMNKPKGFVTTLDDPHTEKAVVDIIKSICKERVYPVGRLDKNSVGVLLITNDGELTRKLTHPGSNKKKIYQVSLDKALTKTDMQKIADGIELEDGVIAADAISYVGESKKDIGIEIHSGRNRIVRRIFEALGYNVLKLDRVYFAGLTKKRLRRGAWRFLTPLEVSRLKSGEYE